MSERIHLSDPDNRDDRGASFEFTGSRSKVIKYLDGPLRRDVREEGLSDVDEAIAALNYAITGHASTRTIFEQ